MDVLQEPFKGRKHHQDAKVSALRFAKFQFSKGVTDEALIFGILRRHLGDLSLKFFSPVFKIPESVQIKTAQLAHCDAATRFSSPNICGNVGHPHASLNEHSGALTVCLLYTSDAADEEDSV